MQAAWVEHCFAMAAGSCVSSHSQAMTFVLDCPEQLTSQCGGGAPAREAVVLAVCHQVHSLCLTSGVRCPALPCPALPCPALPCPALPCPALPCPALPCPALPCPALPCPALPCPALPCPALPCPALPCPVLPSYHISCLDVHTVTPSKRCSDTVTCMQPS